MYKSKCIYIPYILIGISYVIWQETWMYGTHMRVICMFDAPTYFHMQVPVFVYQEQRKHNNPSPVPCRLDWLNYAPPFIFTFTSKIVCTIVEACNFSLCVQWTGVFLSLRSSVARDYIILGYSTASLGSGIPTFRVKILSSSLRVKIPKCLCWRS